MKQLPVLAIVLAFFAFPGLPVRAQLYSQENYSSNGGTGFDTTIDSLQRKAEEQRKRRELAERQRRLSENAVTNTPERLLLDSYFSRRSDAPSKRR